MAIPLINGINYAWGDISLMIPTVRGAYPVVGITEIEYDETQEIDENYGGGEFPIGVGLGNFKCKGSITLYREEIRQLSLIAPNGKIQLIPPFPIKCVYGNNSQALAIDTLPFCIFRNNTFSSKQGDKKMVSKIDLFIGTINWG